MQLKNLHIVIPRESGYEQCTALTVLQPVFGVSEQTSNNTISDAMGLEALRFLAALGFLETGSVFVFYVFPFLTF